MIEFTTVLAAIPVTCPVGYRPVAMRVPKRGECYYGPVTGGVFTASHDFTNGRYLILEPIPRWCPPEWFPRNVTVSLCNGAWLLGRKAVAPMQCNYLARLFGDTFTPPSSGESWQVDANGNATMIL